MSFGKNSGPSIPPAPQNPFGPPPSATPPPPRSPPPATRDASFHWGDGRNPPFRDFGDPNQNRSPPSGSLDVGTSFSSKASHFMDLRETRSPVQYTEDFLVDPTSDGLEQPGSHSSGSLNERSNSPSKIIDSWKPKEFSSKDEMQRSFHFSQDAPKRPSFSPPKLRNGTGDLVMPDFQYNKKPSPARDGMNGSTYAKQPVGHFASKRNRSPPAAGGQISLTSTFTEDDTERELQAKARRLARFKTELVEAESSDSMQYGPKTTKKKISSMEIGQSASGKQMSSEDIFSGSTEEMPQENYNENLDSGRVIVGFCSDMCPESERAERERKGDLDRYERLDGDRNQTSETLAVKKYNRTAEREAELIRPMPILQKTMDYLLGLLDQPYDDRFLGLYNFLWDRMRAIRMDLRMQHIFNAGAITMLEQMGSFVSLESCA